MKKIITLLMLMLLVLLVGCGDEEVKQTANVTTPTVTQNSTTTPEPPTPPVVIDLCGNDICDDNETKCSCSEDCGSCSGVAGTCRMYKCVEDECKAVAEEDCCGNNICEDSESYMDCKADCPNIQLSMYPIPFMKDGVTNTNFVIGYNGAGSDAMVVTRIVTGMKTTNTRPGYEEGALLDTDFDKMDKDLNYIIIGNPCQNRFAAELMGNPEDCASVIPEGKALIKLFKNGDTTYTLLVAGGTPDDTLKAGDVLSEYWKHDLDNNEYWVE